MLFGEEPLLKVDLKTSKGQLLCATNDVGPMVLKAEKEIYVLQN